MLRNTSCEQLDLFQYIEYHRIPKNHILLRIDSEISLAFVNDLLAHKPTKEGGMREIKTIKRRDDGCKYHPSSSDALIKS